jgi:hypothetical protein
MSVQKKSLIGKATEKKATTKTVKQTGIGESKGLTASALERRSFKSTVKARAMKSAKIY